MKAKKVNESLEDYVKGKSQEEIKKILGELDAYEKINVGYNKNIDWLLKEGIEELKKIEITASRDDDSIYKVYSGLDAFEIKLFNYTFYPHYFGIIAINEKAAKAKIQILLHHLGMNEENYVSDGEYERDF